MLGVSAAPPSIDVVTEADLDELLPLMRAYCDFYGPAPSDEALLALSRALTADHELEGVQFIARDSDSRAAVGFATIFWSWSTTRGIRIGVMNDLFVAPEARGSGAARGADRCLPRALHRTRCPSRSNGRPHTTTSARRRSTTASAANATRGSWTTRSTADRRGPQPQGRRLGRRSARSSRSSRRSA